MILRVGIHDEIRDSGGGKVEANQGSRFGGVLCDGWMAMARAIRLYECDELSACVVAAQDASGRRVVAGHCCCKQEAV